MFVNNGNTSCKLTNIYEGVSKSSCTNAISFKWHKIPYQTFVMCKTDMCLACVQSFSKLRQKKNKFIKL